MNEYLSVIVVRLLSDPSRKMKKLGVNLILKQLYGRRIPKSGQA